MVNIYTNIWYEMQDVYMEAMSHDNNINATWLTFSNSFAKYT